MYVYVYVHIWICIYVCICVCVCVRIYRHKPYIYLFYCLLNQNQAIRSYLYLFIVHEAPSVMRKNMHVFSSYLLFLFYSEDAYKFLKHCDKSSDILCAY